MLHRNPVSHLVAATVALALAASVALPAGAQPLEAEPAVRVPVTTAPAPATTEPAPDPSEAAQAAASLRKELAAAGDPGAAERVRLSEQAYAALGTGAADAHMGQGLKRLEETDNPQAPTIEELERLAAAAEDVAAGTAAEQPQTTPTPGTSGVFHAETASLQIQANTESLRTWRPPGVLGVDVSGHQGNVDWSYAWGKDTRFAYVKATESWGPYANLYKNPYFPQQYNGSANQGMVRGAYHFAKPAHSSGRDQAIEFMDNGGGWSADGKTLPPLLDIEWNPYTSTTYPEGEGDACYGLTPAQMVSWIEDFGSTVEERTGRLPMIYTAQSWWDVCTGDSTAFKDWPLHVSLVPTATSVPKNARELPEGWTTFNIWQYTFTADLIGSTQEVDGNVWNGDLATLKDFANNRRSTPYRLTTEYLGDGDVWPTRLAPVRLGGANRYETAVAISRKTFPSAAPAVVVASGNDFPDALSGSAFAVSRNAPLLLTPQAGVPSQTLSEIRRLSPKAIYVLGGGLSVGSDAERELADIAPVTRLQGGDRYETAKDISDTWSSANTVFLASGRNYPDALSLAAVAARAKQPLLLTQTDALPPSTAAALRRLKPQAVHIAGGPSVVSPDVVAEIEAAVPGISVTRKYGADRYATSAAIANHYFWSGSQRQFFTSGANYPDGLTGAVSAAYNGAPLLLTRQSCMPSPVADALANTEGWTNVLLGGTGVISSTGVYSAGGEPSVC
ncbi:cell wall-binding repeat-containing protein [Arthrobacter sp. KK5.5]|uniref:cell wall-binding repeat-containing protein n=1 Tax=Arthrobacter sp. KK5.5 TaxID=3373084 RepID=UPI003EE69670